MSSFKDQLAADLEAVFYNDEDFAESVSYTPHGGTAKTVKKLVTYGEGDEAGQEWRVPDTYGVNATIQVMTFGEYGLATVTNQDKLQIEGRTWCVVGAHKINDGLEWLIEIIPEAAN